MKMKKIKRFFAAALGTVMVASMVMGCGGNSGGSSSDSGSSTAAESDSAEDSGEKKKVCFVDRKSVV